MIENNFAKVARVRNNLDASHCTQFAVLAALETLGDSSLDVETVDEATGYMPGGTWPYTMINWFAEHGYDVVHIEPTDFDLFLRSPRLEFTRQGLPTETIDLFFEISDFDFELKALNRAISNSKISLEARRPEISDITTALDNGWLPIISLDATVLNGGDPSDFDGHVVIATGWDDRQIRLQDPGPPMHTDWDVTHGVVLRALRNPSEDSGTVTLIRRAI